MSKGEKHHNLHHWNCRNPGSHRAQPPKSTAGGGYPHHQAFNRTLHYKIKEKHHE